MVETCRPTWRSMGHLKFKWAMVKPTISILSHQVRAIFVSKCGAPLAPCWYQCRSTYDRSCRDGVETMWLGERREPRANFSSWDSGFRNPCLSKYVLFFSETVPAARPERTKR